MKPVEVTVYITDSISLMNLLHLTYAYGENLFI